MNTFYAYRIPIGFRVNTKGIVLREYEKNSNILYHNLNIKRNLRTFCMYSVKLSVEYTIHCKSRPTGPQNVDFYNVTQSSSTYL